MGYGIKSMATSGNPILENFMNGNGGDRAEDYYYVYNTKNAKCYYSYLTSKRVAKDRIPAYLLDAIQPKDADFDIGELLRLKQGHLEEIKKLETKIHAIDLKLATVKKSGDDEILKKSQVKKQQREERTKVRQEEIKKEKEEFLRHLHAEEYRRQQQQYTPSKVDPSILVRLKITTRDEWHGWLRNNHPDKGGQGDLCSQVITTGRQQGW